MYKKHMKHLLMVALKYFFDFDYSFCYHAFLTALLVIGLVKIFIFSAGFALYEGMLTIKEDALTIKNDLLTVKEQWNSSDLKQGLIANIRSLKNGLAEKDRRYWRLGK